MITINDLDVQHGTARWGGPTATATVTAGPLTGRTFWLRSTQGLDRAGDLTKGGGIHLDAADPEDSHRAWRGAFRTFDMGEALNLLVDYINDLAVRASVENAMWGPAARLDDALRGFRDALAEASHGDFRAEWRNILTAVAAMEAVMVSDGKEA